MSRGERGGSPGWGQRPIGAAAGAGKPAAVRAAGPEMCVCFLVRTPPSSQALATAVAQLVVAEPGGVPGGAPGGSWSPRGCGVACLVRDGARRSYFIRLYSLTSGSLWWEQELQGGMGYACPTPFFHTFTCHVSGWGHRTPPLPAVPIANPDITESRHVGHIGWDPNNGFDVAALDPALRTLFARRRDQRSAIGRCRDLAADPRLHPGPGGACRPCARRWDR
ncbi:hypothetical protein Q9233_017350, partial [Columba guinea]